MDEILNMFGNIDSKKKSDQILEMQDLEMKVVIVSSILHLKIVDH